MKRGWRHRYKIDHMRYKNEKDRKKKYLMAKAKAVKPK